MAFPNMTSGGAFKGAAQGQGYNHDNALKMAHAAHRKMAVAGALSAGPHMANFKAQVAHGAAQRGAPATVQHVHNAIDSLTQKGALTPLQGNALKQHNGPLQGPQGANTVGMITDELVNNPKVRQ